MRRSRLFLITGVSFVFAAAHCRSKERPAKARPAWLSESEFAELRQAGIFLASLQRADGSITADAASGTDSPIGQTGYALRVLAGIDELTGGFARSIEAGRAFLVRQAEPNGLWKYKSFLPADLDDTTAAFAALNQHNPEEYALLQKCAASVTRLQDQDGGLRTWLITDQDLRAMRLNAAAFRVAERHPEVMAYFFEALGAREFTVYEKNLDTAAEFLSRHQRPDGDWQTTWYRSDLYAVYRVHRYLSVSGKYRDRYARHLGVAEKYALAKRLPDGTWGKNGQPSVLDTAFGFGILAPNSKRSKVDLERALQFIRASRLPSGGWPAEPFFFLDISQRMKTSGEPVFIGSELYTTSVVAEILLSYYRLRLPVAGGQSP